MATGALFGGSTGSRPQSQNLVEFRSGKMFMRGKMVHPDKRKGLLYVYQSDDSLMHFCWKDRTSGVVEDDLIIFPDDIEYKKVSQCTTGRVFILKFKSSSRKFFFWMQEPKTDKDEEYCKQVNDFLNNPPAPGSNRGGTGSGLGGNLPPELAGLANDSDINSLLSNMNQQQLMELLSGMGMGGAGGGGLSGLSSLIGGRPGSAQSTDSTTPSRAQSSPGGARTTVTESRPTTTTAATTAASTAATVTSATNSAASSRAQIQLSDLQNILSSMNVTGTPQSEPIDLSKALSHETLIPILANPEVQERLVPFLPEGETLPKSAEELHATVLSPQFQQAVSTFSSALASGQLGPLIQQFGLGDDAAAAAAAGDVEGFVKAVQEYEKKQKENKEEKMDEGN